MIPAKEIDGELWIRAADVRIKKAAEVRLQMDLRDYFAAKSMNAFLVDVSVGEDDLPSIAKSAYMVADAMLKEREK